MINTTLETKTDGAGIKWARIPFVYWKIAEVAQILGGGEGELQ